MKQEDVVTAQQLEAKLVIHELKDHARLWKTAQGRLGWRGVGGLLLPLLLVGIGLAQRIQEVGVAGVFRDLGATWFIVLGVAMLALTAWGNMHAQLAATLELVRRLERRGA